MQLASKLLMKGTEERTMCDFSSCKAATRGSWKQDRDEPSRMTEHGRLSTEVQRGHGGHDYVRRKNGFPCLFLRNDSLVANLPSVLHRRRGLLSLVLLNDSSPYHSFSNSQGCLPCLLIHNDSLTYLLFSISGEVSSAYSILHLNYSILHL